MCCFNLVRREDQGMSFETTRFIFRGVQLNDLSHSRRSFPVYPKIFGPSLALLNRFHQHASLSNYEVYSFCVVNREVDGAVAMDFGRTFGPISYQCS